MIWFDLIDWLIAWLITYRMYIYTGISAYHMLISKIFPQRLGSRPHSSRPCGIPCCGSAPTLGSWGRYGEMILVYLEYGNLNNLTMKNMEIHWGLWPPWNNIQYGFLVVIWDGFWDVLKKIKIWNLVIWTDSRKWLEKWGHNPVGELQIP